MIRLKKNDPAQNGTNNAKNAKRKAAVLALAAACLLIGLAFFTDNSIAYFTTSAVARNVITAGTIQVDLVEKDAAGNAFQNPVNVVPGAEIEKVVTVENTGSNPCWVRIGVEKSVELAEGVSGEADLSLISIDFNTDDWTEKDGWFYYNNALESGETTEALFTAVTFSKDMGNLYQSSVATVLVKTQVVQAQNNGSSAMDAAGWPADGEGGGIG